MTNSERSSAIVQIAYYQLSVMCGTRNPTASTTVATANIDDAKVRGMMCTRRLLNLPIFTTVTSTFRDAYAATRASHESIAIILSHAENGMRAGLEFASPVTGKFVDFLEKPLKIVDDALCTGLDFIEEKIPSVKLPPGQIYANAKDSVRNIFTSALETLAFLLDGSKDRIKDLSVANKPIQEIRKTS